MSHVLSNQFEEFRSYFRHKRFIFPSIDRQKTIFRTCNKSKSKAILLSRVDDHQETHLSSPRYANPFNGLGRSIVPICSIDSSANFNRKIRFFFVAINVYENSNQIDNDVSINHPTCMKSISLFANDHSSKVTASA